MLHSFFAFLRRLWRGLATPVVREWSFMLIFFVGISFSMLYTRAIEHTLHEVNLVACLRGIGIAYLLASLIDLTRWQWLKIPFYAVASFFFAVQTFLMFNFGLFIDPKVFTLLIETTPTETAEFWSEYLWAPHSLLCYGLTLVFVLVVIYTEWMRRKKRTLATANVSDRTNKDSGVSLPRWVLALAVVLLTIFMIYMPGIRIRFYWPMILGLAFILWAEKVWWERRSSLCSCHQGRRCVKVVSFFLLVIFSGVIGLGLKGLDDIPKIFQASSEDDMKFMVVDESDGLTLSLYSYRYVQLMGKMIQPALEATLEVQDAHRLDSEPLTVIMVVGESYIKYHTPLYGYQRDTSPRLCREQREGKLFTFDNVVATHNYTAECLKNAYSLNSIALGEAWYEKPFFPYLFRQAGFDVYAWDNQYDRKMKSEHTYPMTSYLYASEFEKLVYNHICQTTFSYDGELIDDYQQRIHLAPNASSFVIFHLYGQHHPTVDRYPQTDEWHYFKPEDYLAQTPEYSDGAREHMAHYDNATRYNDYILGRIFDLYKDRNTVVVYFSDHGEEVYDYRNSYARLAPAEGMDAQWLKYQFDIPLMIWCSDRYQELYPEMMDRIRAAQHTPFMLDLVGYILLDVAHIDSSSLREELNPLSSKFQVHPRIILDYWHYDELRPTIN